MSRPLRGALVAAVLLCLSAVSPAAPRELHWRAVDVRAQLDPSGALHVVERQAMVFTGDWNGGERIFRVFPGQTLTIDGITRIGEDGARLPLPPGDLSAVDQFAWKDGRTLRWRSRLPSDPPFEGKEIVYEIGYTLSGILLREGDRYVLDHNFVFPDRSGVIEQFSLELTLESPWRPAGAFQGTLSRRSLQPGEDVVLRIPLTWGGEGRPAGVRVVAGRSTRLALFAVLVAVAAALYLVFRAREKALGRFLPAPAPESIDARWLEEQLFSLAPEEAGALWDGKIGSPEVSAVLARLAAEKKIGTRIDGKKMSLSLLAPADGLSGYDKKLIHGLFFGGRNETDSDAIRKHYASSGFDPAATIRPGLTEKLEGRPEFRDRAPRAAGWPAPVLFLLGVAALAWSVVSFGELPGRAIGTAIVYLLLWAIGGAFALLHQKRADRPESFAAVFLWMPVFVLLLAWRGASSPEPASPAFVAGVFLLRLAILFGVFAVARTRQGPRRVARRKALAAARGFFERELAKPAPQLRDEWFPWIVALGLAGDADRWFRVHGAAAGASSSGSGSGSFSSGSSSSSSSSSASPASSWSGGGGSFGGAGASSSWGVAAGALAAGVAAPSSSGGGGGGGGGGGSSGGGGGGGW